MSGDTAGGWRFWVLPAVLTVLLVALVATSVVLVRDRRVALPPEQAVQPADLSSRVADGTPAEQAVARARLAARTYFTLDHASVEADMDRLRALGTPEFVAGYDRMARALARRITDRRLRLTASLPRDGVATEYLSQNLAQLLVSVDVTTQRPRASNTEAYRTRVVLERVDDAWLVAALDAVA